MADFGIDGVRVGHWTATRARTGCTVIRFDRENVASGEVRGGAPATREFSLLDARRSVSSVDAIVLSGGSAFGLAAGDGAAAALAADGIGFETAHGRIPIVIGMSLYDLGVGSAHVRPTAATGAEACAGASPTFGVGRVGAGTGATVGKWRGAEAARPAGLGFASTSHDGLVVSALVAVNAAGDLDADEFGEGTSRSIANGSFEWPDPGGDDGLNTNTTIGVVVTNADFSKVECRSIAEAAHDGLARAVIPSHGPYDGDAFIAVAVPHVEAPLGAARLLATAAVEAAIGSVA